MFHRYVLLVSLQLYYLFPFLRWWHSQLKLPNWSSRDTDDRKSFLFQIAYKLLRCWPSAAMTSLCSPKPEKLQSDKLSRYINYIFTIITAMVVVDLVALNKHFRKKPGKYLTEARVRYVFGCQTSQYCTLYPISTWSLAYLNELLPLVGS